jgi:hypothetical protein
MATSQLVDNQYHTYAVCETKPDMEGTPAPIADRLARMPMRRLGQSTAMPALVAGLALAEGSLSPGGVV